MLKYFRVGLYPTATVSTAIRHVLLLSILAKVEMKRFRNYPSFSISNVRESFRVRVVRCRVIQNPCQRVRRRADQVLPTTQISHFVLFGSNLNLKMK